MHVKLQLLVISLLVGFSGCAHNGRHLGVASKSEARNFVFGEPIILKADYLRLARFWDENVAKPTTISGGVFSRIDLFEAEQTAHLVCGGGVIQGMIELKGLPDGNTRMTTYAWGPLFKTVVSWRDMVAAAPFVQH